MATAAEPSGLSVAPDPQELAATWVTPYAWRHKPRVDRIGNALVITAAVALTLWPAPLPGHPFLLLCIASVLASVLTGHRADLRIRSLRQSLAGLAAMPGAADAEFAATVAAVLREAHPALSAAKPLTPEQARTIIADTALRLFVRRDIEGCSTGHNVVCRHRRNNDAWMAWLDEAEPDEPTAPTSTSIPPNAAVPDTAVPDPAVPDAAGPGTSEPSVTGEDPA